MKKYYYDLHIHSCLSPCGDDDSTPNNVAAMASLSELNIVALTDHNTCKNCPAFFAAARKYGITSIPNVIAFKNGAQVDNSLGFVPQAALEAFVEKNL